MHVVHSCECASTHALAHTCGAPNLGLFFALRGMVV